MVLFILPAAWWIISFQLTHRVIALQSFVRTATSLLQLITNVLLGKFLQVLLVFAKGHHVVVMKNHIGKLRVQFALIKTHFVYFPQVSQQCVFLQISKSIQPSANRVSDKDFIC